MEANMKIGRKLIILWAASLALFSDVGVASWLTMDLMTGVSGLAILFSLGYCGIIVVSQVFAALVELRQLLADLAAGKPGFVKSLFD
jgi:putative effector of murein hydrolase LrgA (UPF0299 family)